MRIVLFTVIALLAFAFNSILCRLALGSEAIDAPGFTAIRLFSGAVTLIILSYFFNQNRIELKRGNWISAFFLFAYAICFSLAYVSLTAATGALILFGSVQLTMIAFAVASGNFPRIREWIGLVLAFSGLVYLVFPGLTAPPIYNSALMIAAGISWGAYTLRGKGSINPLADTTGNFVRSLPFLLLLAVPYWSAVHLSDKGIFLAIFSGSVASGGGYAIWYSVLKDHTATRAAILQLAVPAIAAFGGVLFLSESISIRLIAASLLILGGIAFSIVAGRKK